jgi:hypothetical protein
MEPAHFGERADEEGPVCEGRLVNTFRPQMPQKTNLVARSCGSFDDIHSCTGIMRRRNGIWVSADVHGRRLVPTLQHAAAVVLFGYD